ncbi:MAG: hypothetical protein CBC48_19840 [bacterium TMED88]|nr:hypothetical protein [Deltaproteobacteria bacterium]OUV21841.1 MAG: hypothetical protein CBC48_19840 [bacterium TMED88]
MNTPNTPHIAKGLDRVVVLAAAGLGLLTSAGAISLRFGLLGTGLLLTAALIRARTTFSPRFIVVLITSLSAAGLLEALGGERLQLPYVVAQLFVWIGLIVVVALALWNREFEAIRSRSSQWSFAAVAALILFAGSAVTLIRLYLGSPLTFTPDENIYAFQSTYVFDDFRGIEIQAWLEPFFRIRQTFVRDGFLSGQYTPGWPAFLALLKIAGLAEVAGYIMYSAILVALTVWVRMLRSSWEVAALAVALAASSYDFFYFNTSFFSHGLGALLGLVATIAALAASRHSGLQSAAYWAIAGAAISLMATVRPLNGTIGLLLLVAWVIYSRQLAFRSVIGSSLGLLLFGVPLLVYNHFSTGDMFQFGYDLAQEGLQRPGFGTRGSVGFTDSGASLPHGWDFTPWDGILNLFEIVGGSLLSFWPGGLIFVLLAAGIDRKQIHWSAAAPWLIGCLSLPVAYALYAFGDPRMVVEALPFAAGGSALWAAHSLQHDPRITRTLIWTTVLLGASVSIGQIFQLQGNFETKRTYIEMVERVREERGPLLVFVQEAQSYSAVEHGLEALFWFNARPEKKVIVGRHVDHLRPYIIGHYPHHQPLLFFAGAELPGGAWAPGRIELLAPPAQEPPKEVNSQE